MGGEEQGDASAVLVPPRVLHTIRILPYVRTVQRPYTYRLTPLLLNKTPWPIQKKSKKTRHHQNRLANSCHFLQYLTSSTHTYPHIHTYTHIYHTSYVQAYTYAYTRIRTRIHIYIKHATLIFSSRSMRFRCPCVCVCFWLFLLLVVVVMLITKYTFE